MRPVRRTRLFTLIAILALVLCASLQLPAETPEREPDVEPAAAPVCPPVTRPPLIRRKGVIVKDGRIAEGKYERYHDAAILHLHGLPYEMGYQHGVMLGAEIRDALDRAQKRRGPAMALERTEWLFRYYLKWPDWAQEELAGLARGANVLTADLVWLNVTYARLAGGPHPEAGPRREAFDPDLLDSPRWVMAVYHPDGAPPYAAVIRPGAVGVIAGLRPSSCCLTAWTPEQDRRAEFQIDSTGPKSQSQVTAREQLAKGLCGQSVDTVAGKCEVGSFALGEELSITLTAKSGLICIHEPGRPAAAVDVNTETFSEDCAVCEDTPNDH